MDDDPAAAQRPVMARVHRRVEQRSRWAGPVTDLEKAAKLAAAELRAPRQRAVPVTAVIALPGRVIETGSLDDLFGGLLDTRDLPLIRTLKIDIGRPQAPRVAIHCENTSPTLSLEVVGDDRTTVEGLAAMLVSVLARGKQPPLNPYFVAALILTLTLISGATALLNITPGLADLRSELPVPAWLVSGPSLVAVALGVIYVGYRVFLPSLEILTPDGRPAINRLRGWIVAFVVMVAAGVVGTLLVTNR